jgi:hypothetical protein
MNKLTFSGNKKAQNPRDFELLNALIDEEVIRQGPSTYIINI